MVMAPKPRHIQHMGSCIDFEDRSRLEAGAIDDTAIINISDKHAALSLVLLAYLVVVLTFLQSQD